MQVRNTETPGPSDESPLRGRGESSPVEGRPKRKREDSLAPPDTSNGETFVNLKQGGLEDDGGAPDTVLDGMGALNLGDEEDYGYFGH
jgi:hypothetical protein